MGRRDMRLWEANRM
ncbi:hypothetical protein CRE_19514 [Caenorhabditis remanei]|uniref:Uncharacterized protein n=1 Tax=Caenorhabditis remanei TaxID=31234 RepID=E3NI09_CAERE|nr:hypothetical protein CRE_19514 [Caenorhabditis remanei]